LNTPDIGHWHRTSPFAILFFFGRILRRITNNAWQSLAPLLAFLVAYQGDLVTKLTMGGIAFVVVLSAASILSYLFFRYQIREDSILIRQGVIKKKQLDIKFERIQGVNTKQNPVYRVLGLVTISFDTAGSAANEGNLPAVTREFANALRERIGNKKDKQATDDTVVAAPTDVLLKLDWRDMVRIGLADRRVLIIFAFVGPLLDQMGDKIERYVESQLETAAFEAFQIGIGTGAMILMGTIVAIFLILAIVSIAIAILRYHNFELLLDGRTLRSHGGLLTRHEHSMDLEKIQTLRLQQGVLQSGLRRYKMTARQAISGGRRRARKMFEIPVVTATQADRLRAKFLTPEGGTLTQDPRSDLFTPISPYYMRAWILFLGLVPASILAAALWTEVGIGSLIVFIWLPIVSLVSWRNWKRAGYLHDDHEIVRRSGLFGYRTVGLLFRKVQRITISQSRYQRRKGLASLQLHMASGSVRVPYIDHATARKLRDYILYKVESSEKAWH
jgi:putative membrane protein